MPINEISLALACIVVLAAAFVRAYFGFGDALLAMPLLSSLFDPRLVAPIIALDGFLISVYILRKSKGSFKAAKINKLTVFAILGVPFGVYFLINAQLFAIKIVLAIVVVFYAVFKLINPNALQLKNDKYAFVFGLISGALGGAYNVKGPPIVVYGAARGWKASEFRVLLQGVFLPTTIFIILFQGFEGLWTKETAELSAAALPFIVLGCALGNRLQKKTDPEKFAKYVYYALAIVGLFLLSKTVLA